MFQKPREFLQQLDNRNEIYLEEVQIPLSQHEDANHIAVNSTEPRILEGEPTCPELQPAGLCSYTEVIPAFLNIAEDADGFNSTDNLGCSTNADLRTPQETTCVKERTPFNTMNSGKETNDIDNLHEANDNPDSVFELREKSVLKGKRGYTQALRKQRKLLKNSGKEYTDVNGKVHAARKSQSLKHCRMRCNAKITDSEREKLFEEYWSLGNRDRRVTYLAGLIRTREKASQKIMGVEEENRKYRFLTHSYSLNINSKNTPVCKGCFLMVFGETNSFIQILLANKQANLSGTTYPDMRGKRPPQSKWSDEAREEVRKHILSFPQYESHCPRNHRTKTFLPSHLTVTTMYKLYCEKIVEPVCKTIYERTFHSLNLFFKKPKRNICHKCDFYQMSIKVLQRENKDDETVQEEFRYHKQQANIAYSAKGRDEENAKESKSTRVIVFGLQQCLPTPFIKAKVAFYKRHLWTFNLTLHDCTAREVTCYMWHEGIAARGANEIASCIFKHITCNIPSDVENIICYSDACGGQIRNNHISAMFTTALQKIEHLNCIDHKFMTSGHSLLECDYDNYFIERRKKQSGIEIFHPRDWYQLVRTVSAKKRFLKVVEMTQNDFIDFSMLLGNSLIKKVNENNENFQWNEAKWVRYTKDYGTIMYKKSHEENDIFHKLSCRRYGTGDPCLNINKCYKGPNPISEKKKKDLTELLEFIDPLYHSFYKDLATSSCAQDEDPDITASGEELFDY